MKNIIILFATILLLAVSAFAQTTIYVGNLSSNLKDQDLENLFAAFGEVKSAHITTDKNTQVSKGFGFVVMALADQAQAAITALNGTDVDGRNIVVNEAKPSTAPSPTPAPAPTRADFSGTWKLDKQKSELGQLEPYATHTIQVEQKADAITFLRTAPGFTGQDYSYSETLPFDGKVVESVLFGTSKRKGSIKWTPDQKGFVITYTLYLDFNGQTVEVTGTETYTLSADGRILTIVANSKSSLGDAETKAVYGKS